VKVSFSLPQSDLPALQARTQASALIVTLNCRRLGRQLVAPVDFISMRSNQSGTIECARLEARVNPIAAD